MAVPLSLRLSEVIARAADTGLITVYGLLIRDAAFLDFPKLLATKYFKSSKESTEPPPFLVSFTIRVFM